MRNKIFSLHWTVSIFFIIIFSLALFKVCSLDIWWHLKTGELILTNFSIPQYDIFSHTSSGTPWVPTQWLSQVTFYLIHHFLGISGLIITKALLAVVIFTIPLALLRGWSIPQRISVCCLISFAVVARYRFFLRPDIFSFLFLSLELYFLEKWRKKKSKDCFFLLPLTMLLWANYHSGATIGLVVLALFFLALISGFFLKKEKAIDVIDVRTTFFLLVLSAMATLINPNGIKLYLFAIEHYDIYAKIRIAESAAPSFRMFPLYYILLSIVWLTQILNIKKSPFFHLLLLIFFTFLSLKTLRMIAWWAMAVAPLATANIHSIKEQFMDRHGKKEWLPEAVKNCLVITFMGAIFYLEVFFFKGYHNWYEFGIGVKDGLYPIGAVDFVNKNDLQGNMYNDQNFGGYILWRTYPERKVFNDPRMQVYYKLFPEFKNWKGLLDKYDINYGILEYPDSIYYKETPFPEGSWVLVYWDDDAMVYLKRDRSNRDIITKYGYKVMTRPYDEDFSYIKKWLKNFPEVAASIKNELMRNPGKPGYRQKILLANLEYMQGFTEKAISYLKKAIQEKPRMQNAYYHLGKILISIGDKNEGIKYLKTCKILVAGSKYGKLAEKELRLISLQ